MGRTDRGDSPGSRRGLRNAPGLAVLMFSLSVYLSAVVAGAGPSEAGAAGPSRTPVILVVFDELPTASLLKRPGKIDATRFPNFDRLSKVATWYPYNTTSSDLTVRAIPSLLTGRQVLDAKPATASNYSPNLFSLLRSRGYSQRILEYSSELCPHPRCPLPKGDVGAVRRITDPFEFMSFKIPRRVRQVREDFPKWIGGFRADRDLTFAHSFLPHEPYYYLPDGRRYPSKGMPRMAEGDIGPIIDPQSAAGQAWQRQLIQIGRVDRLLGMLRTVVTKAGAWDRSLVIVTSDHGASFRSGINRRLITPENAASIAYTPLFIKYPEQKTGSVSPKRTQLVDLMPTILDVTGSDPVPTDGVSIRDLPESERPAVIGGVEFEHEELMRGLRTDLKLKRRLLGDRGLFQLGPSPELIGQAVRRKRTLAGPARVNLANTRWIGRAGFRAGGWVPALFYGTTSLRPGTRVAIVLNRRVAGTATVFADGKRRRFGTVVDPALLKGKPRITVHLVRKGRIGPRVY